MKPGFEKRFNKEDLVYWCHKKAHEYSVQYGLVDEQFSDAVIIDYIVPRERRIIDGIPLDEFKSEERYRKLPKGWSYDTKLFEVTHEVLDEEENELLSIYLSGLQSYLPLEAIQAQLLENPHKVKQEEEISDEKLIEIISILKSSGVDESYIEELLKTELFKNKGELLHANS